MKMKISKAWFYLWWLVRFTLKMTTSLALAYILKDQAKYKNLWLIMELPNEARDNGYILYMHIVNNHPDINVKYVLNYDSPDYYKISETNSTIQPYSWEHYISYILCRFSISTHIYGASPGRYFTKIFNAIIPDKHEIFLQHGITKEPIPLRGFSQWTITASHTEKDHFIQSGHKNPDKILPLGFCRFDTLIDTSRHENEKTILVMPTFRSWLGGHVTSDKGAFMESKFYTYWNSFLSNLELISWLDQSNFKLIFYPHRQMQSFSHLFNSSHPNIEIATQSKYDIQDLLRSSSVLVTDYSSVFYDFSYMKKPVLFYQFDKAEFYEKHHKYSGKPYPFGVYKEDEKTLIDALLHLSEAGFAISDKIDKEIDNFFIYTDRENCERNVNAIRKLI